MLKTKKEQIPSYDLPSVSFIICAYKEESIIARKIENTLQLDYPNEKFEIIVCSDGTLDKSKSIVESFSEEGIISLHSNKRLGKAMAINRGVSHAKHEIICLSDANCLLDKFALKYLMKEFDNANTGAVTGRKMIVKSIQRKAANDNHLYWGLEAKIKTWQSELGSITTGDGELFALRRRLVAPLERGIVNDDTILTLRLTAQGMGVKYCPKALCYEEGSITLKEEYHVKKRIAFGHLQTLSNYWMLIIKSGPLFTWNFFSHKIIRHLIPYFCLSLIISSLWLATVNHDSKLGIIIAMTLLFVLVIRRSHQAMVNFLLANIAILHGTIQFLRKSDNLSIWIKATRQ